MFTGLTEEMGELKLRSAKEGDYELSIATTARFMKDVGLGDSIAVNGVCLTVTKISNTGFIADVSRETVAHTNIVNWRPGTKVNLEKALTLSTRLGGHLVTGHVDGVGRVIDHKADARSMRLTIEAPVSLHRYLAPKGSITIDGVSLTINQFEEGCIGLNIVPHTAEKTTLAKLTSGDHLHLEVDILARYMEQLLKHDKATPEAEEKSTLDKQFLIQHGFMKPN